MNMLNNIECTLKALHCTCQAANAGARCMNVLACSNALHLFYYVATCRAAAWEGSCVVDVGI